MSAGVSSGSVRSFGSSRVWRVGLLLVALVALAVFVGVGPAFSQTVPTISIASVVTDQTVTVQTANFPPNQNFTVTMGPFGSKGVNGIVVGTTNSGAGGSFSATYNIPAQLKGAEKIAIRMQTAHTNPFFAYNWFYNNTTTGPGTGPGTGGIPGYTGVPTFSIVSVTPDTDVTIETDNFPPNQTFTVLMGPFGTQAINGIPVGTMQSGVGGKLRATFNIPAQLKGSNLVAIRAQTAHTNPFFAYNWFYNSTAGTGGIPPTPPPDSGYTGVPTFKVCSVVRNQSVTINASNLPPNQTFTVTMGSFGTQGVGGYTVGTLSTGNGGSQTATFNIPSQLADSYRIAMRMQTGQADPFFAYNWFYNNTATVC